MPESPECSILLIEDEPDAARLVEYVLSKAAAPKLAVDWAPDLRQGLRRLGEREFQAILLDLNLPDSSGFETFVRVRQHSGCAVIVLTAQEDEEMALQAVRAGADEYLIKSEIRDRFLAQRIRYAIERKRMQQSAVKIVRKGKVLSFLGAKGGSGTTTLVLNLAAMLAKSGEGVVAVELVPGYGSFAACLRQTAPWNTGTLFQTPAEAITRQQVESCLADLPCGFRVLLGPQRPEEYGEIAPGHARALLHCVAPLADYTLIELPPSIGPYTREVVRHSGFVTLVAEHDWLGLDAAAAKAPALHSEGVPEGALGLVIVNRTPYVEMLPANEFARRAGCALMAVVPPASDLLASDHSGTPLVLRRPDTLFSECIYEMGKRFCVDPVRLLGGQSGGL